MYTIPQNYTAYDICTSNILHVDILVLNREF
jgi:hypothetical protein